MGIIWGGLGMSNSRWERFKQSVSAIARTQPARYFFSCVNGVSAGSGVYAASTCCCLTHPCGCVAATAACAAVSVVTNRQLRRGDEVAEAFEVQSRELATLRETTRDITNGIDSEVDRQREVLNFMIQKMEDGNDKEQCKKMLMTPAEESAARKEVESKQNPFTFFSGKSDPIASVAEIYDYQKEENQLDQSEPDADQLMDELEMAFENTPPTEKTPLNPGPMRKYMS